jgi:hypothetical protein
MAYVQLPNGVYLEIPKGMDPHEAYAKAQQQMPEAFLSPAEREERQGFGSAVKQGWNQAKSATEAGLGSLLNSDTLKAWAEQDKAEGAKESFIPTTEEDVKAGFKEGLLPGVGAGFRKYVSEPVGGIVGRYAAPAAVGAGAGALAAVAAPEIAGASLIGGMTGRALAGSLATAASDLPAEIGENLEYQKEKGKPENLPKAVAAGLLQATFAGFGLPGMGALPKYARGLLGKEATSLGEQVAAGTLNKTDALAKLSGTTKNFLTETGSNAIAGTGMMVGTEAARRASAGEDLLSPEALQSYKESALGAAELSPIFGALHGLPKRKAETKAIEAGASHFAETERKQQQIKDDEEAARLADRQQQIDFEQSQRNTGDLLGMEVPEQEQPGVHTVARDQRTVAEKEQAVDEMSSHRQMLENSIPALKQTIETVEGHLNTAIEKGDTAKYKELSTRHAQLSDVLETTKKQLEALGPTEKTDAQQRVALEKQLKTAKSEFQSLNFTNGQFDKERLDALTTKIETTQKKLDDLGPAKETQGAFDFEAGAKEDQAASAAKQAEELTQEKYLGEKAAPATEEDIAAQKEQQANYDQAVQRHSMLADLFTKANNSNDIQGAIQIKQLMEQSAAAVEAAKPQARTEAEPSREQALNRIDPIEEARQIRDLENKAKALDDQMKAAANKKQALEKDGDLTPAGQKLAAIQVERDQALADIKRRQDALTAQNLREGSEKQTTAAVANAFPRSETSPEVMGRLATLKRHVGDNLTLRGALMGLKRKLDMARGKRNQAGANRGEVMEVIGQMRNLAERIQNLDQDIDLPIGEHVPERIRKYHELINGVRREQRKHLETYLDSLSALANRDYIGGATKRAKLTKSVLENRVAQAEKAFSDSLMDEVATHRQVAGSMPLNEQQVKEVKAKFMEAVGDIKRLATGEIASPEAAQAVIAEHIANVTHDAVSIKNPRTTYKPELRKQFAPTDERSAEIKYQESVIAEERASENPDQTVIAKAQEKIGKLVKELRTEEAQRMAEEDRKAKAPDVSNVGNLEQRDLFSKEHQESIQATNVERIEREIKKQEDIVAEENAKKFPDLKRGFEAQNKAAELRKELAQAKEKQPLAKLEPIATVRATTANFMRFVETQGKKLKAAKEKVAAELAVLEKRAEENKAAAEKRAAAKMESTAESSAELKKQIEIQKSFVEAVANADKLVKGLVEQASGLWISKSSITKQMEKLKTKREKEEGKSRHYSEAKFELDKQIKAVNKELKERLNEIDALHDRANKLKEANIKTERAILSSMERKYEKTPQAQLERQIEQAKTNIRIQEAELTQSIEATAKQNRENEQRLLEGYVKQGLNFVSLSGIKVSGDIVRLRGELVTMKANLKRLKDPVKRDRLRDKIDTKEAEIKEALKPIRTTEEKVADDRLALEKQREKDIDYSKRRKARNEAIAEANLQGAKETAKKEKAKLGEQIKVLEEKLKKVSTPEAEAERVAESRKETGEKRRQLAQERNRLKEKYERTDKKSVAARTKLLEDAANITEKLKATKAKPLTVEQAVAKIKSDIEVLKEKIKGTVAKVEVEPKQSERAKGPAVRVVHSVKMFERGTKKELTPEQRAEKEKEVNDLLKEKDKFDEIERSGLSAEDFGDLFSGLNSNDWEARTDKAHGGEGIDHAEAESIIGKIAKPKGLRLLVVKEATPTLRSIIEATGHNPDEVRGGVLPDGTVFVITKNHADATDLKKTLAHEITGHLGVEGVLGDEGVRALVNKVAKQEGGVFGLAEKLGVSEEVERAHAAAINSGKTEAEAMTAAVKEMIAYTEEARPTKSFVEKANEFIKAMVGLVRAGLRKMGLDLDINTSDIYKLLRDARKDFDASRPIASRLENGEVSFASKPVYKASFSQLLQEKGNSVIAQEKPFTQRIKGNVLGMSLMHRFVDRFAGLEHIAKTITDKLQGVQMMYYNRLYDQRNNMVSEIATHGPVKLEKNQYGEYQYKSANKDGLKNIFETIGKAASEIGNAEAANEQFGLYLAAERAASTPDGLAKLDLAGKITQKELDEIIKFGRANPHFQEARKMYREYNNGLLDLAVQSGRLSKEVSDKLKQGDYVPYYRERADGSIWDEENHIRIGDIKTQQYLKELLGGDKSIVNFEVSSLQNTYMLTDMAMGNIATKNTSHTLRTLGIAEVHDGFGPAGPNILRFYENGEEKHAVIQTSGLSAQLEERLSKMRAEGKVNSPEYKKLRERAETSRQSEALFGDIPGDMIARGMEGISMTLPSAISFLQGPANLLRKAVTRFPAYSARVAFKESIDSWIKTGADVRPIVDVLGNIKKSWQGSSPEVRMLQEQGIIGGHVYAGTMSDMRTISQQMARGQSGWEKLWAKADRLAIVADESARLTLYNGFIKKGLTPMEASLATLESQNFTKHGYSPSVRALSVMIPFFNAQIQGLNTLARAGLGKSLFEDKLNVKNTLLKRGAVVAGMSLLYTALMQNNKAYKNATDDDKLNYWFIPIPGMKDPVRVPIPFESGVVFKALPEAMYNLAATDAKSKDVLPAFAKQIIGNVPGLSTAFLPQGVKPVVEAMTNTDLYSMSPIESARDKTQQAGYRSHANTTEVSKLVGRYLGVSPVQLDHFIQSYTSSTGIALMSMFNPVLRSTAAPEATAHELPIVGGFFQPSDGSGLINKAYDSMLTIEQLHNTYTGLETEDPDRADKFYQKYSKEIDSTSAAGAFKQQMGELNKREREVRGDKMLTPSQKRKELDLVKQDKIDLAKDFRSSVGG